MAGQHPSVLCLGRNRCLWWGEPSPPAQGQDDLQTRCLVEPVSPVSHSSMGANFAAHPGISRLSHSTRFPVTAAVLKPTSHAVCSFAAYAPYSNLCAIFYIGALYVLPRRGTGISFFDQTALHGYCSVAWASMTSLSKTCG